MAHKPRGKCQELPVEAVVHRQDRRANIPTEELRDFVAPPFFLTEQEPDGALPGKQYCSIKHLSVYSSPR